jgi:hypothetical protein
MAVGSLPAPEELACPTCDPDLAVTELGSKAVVAGPLLQFQTRHVHPALHPASNLASRLATPECPSDPPPALQTMLCRHDPCQHDMHKRS